MNAKGDLIFVILMMVAVGIVWVFTGGPMRARLDGPFLKQPPPLGTGETYGQINLKSRSVYIDTKDKKEKEGGTKEKLEDVKINDGFSEFKDKITIETNSFGPSQISTKDEFVTLSASRRNSDPITITGWELESMISGKKVVVGGATEVYLSGIVNQEPKVKLAPGETAIISTGRSPIGTSFKVTKCSGYFEQFQDFSPPLSTRCPNPINEFNDFAVISPNDFTCEDVVRKISTCKMETNALPIGTTNECGGFVSNNINYTGCVKNHRNDIDFFEDEWRIFLGRDEELWRKKRETIKLIDNQGKIVDTYTY